MPLTLLLAVALLSPATPEVRLEPHNNKTTFYLGEPIRLDLVFDNRTGSPFLLNTSDYGDLSEKVEITPSTGFFQWQTQSGHDYSIQTTLGDTPIRVPVRLDEGFIFREPGEYHVRLTTARLMGGDSMLRGRSLSPATTNDLTITLQAMPADVETARLTEIRGVLAGAGRRQHSDRAAALRRLAALQGDDALALKIKLLQEGDDDFRNVYRQAFASTRNLQKQLDLLLQSWTDPRLIPAYDTPDALSETRRLLAGRGLPGWQMTIAPQPVDDVDRRLLAGSHADMAALLDSMPARQGQSRIMAAYFLIEFGGLTDAERVRATDFAVEEFPHMDDLEQHMLLQTARPRFRDPRLATTLRSMVAANPSDTEATAALLAIAPSESSAWIAQSVCSPKAAVMLETFKDVHLDRVPETDACLSARLRLPPANPPQEADWKQRAAAAARFSTAAVLPALREGWKTEAQDGVALAILLRNDPAGAVDLLNKRSAADKLDGLFYEASIVYRQLSEPFPDPVLTWFRTIVETGTDKQARSAAYALSIGGDATDKPRLQRRLEHLQSQWRGHPLTPEAQRTEVDLASALGTYESRTFLDPAQRHQLGQGCLSDACRLYLH